MPPGDERSGHASLCRVRDRLVPEPDRDAGKDRARPTKSRTRSTAPALTLVRGPKLRRDERTILGRGSGYSSNVRWRDAKLCRSAPRIHRRAASREPHPSDMPREGERWWRPISPHCRRGRLSCPRRCNRRRRGTDARRGATCGDAGTIGGSIRAACADHGCKAPFRAGDGLLLGRRATGVTGGAGVAGIV